MYPRARIIVLVPIFFYPLFIEIAAVVYLLFWALTQLFSGAISLAGPAQVAGVAWWAHVGGFAAGVLLHPFFVRPRRTTRPLQRDEYGIEGAWM
jgi:membrane associated rhomboid family serine protease